MIRRLLYHKGFLALIAVFIVVVLGFLSLITAYFVISDMRTQTDTLSSVQALFVAESGLEAGVHGLFNPVFANRITCATVTGNSGLTNITAPNTKGPFTVTGTGPVIPTASTLNGALTASAASIPLVNASTYASSGRVMIDQELMSYMSVSGNTLQTVKRGIDGTVAVAHASGAPVGQYLCTLKSQGGVTALNPAGDKPGGMRTLQATASLPEAWAVGATSGGSAQVILWNNPTEKTWNNKSLTGVNTAFNSVDFLSYADAWAVSANGTIEHWTGNAWAAVPSNTTRALQGVYCTASNNCWAVGATSTFDLWNGTAWAVQTTTLPSVTMNSIFCNASNDCWAVGNTSGGDMFAHWNGTSWSRNSSAPTPAANLLDVTCLSASNCWAVGASKTIVNWNGSAWSASAGTASIPSVTYNGISCASANDCWAVGNASTGSVAVHWNGSAWSRNASATSAAAVNLLSVSCAQSTDCWAVGASSTTLHWDGSNWSAITNPLPAGITMNSVAAFSAGPNNNPVSAWQEIFP